MFLQGHYQNAYVTHDLGRAMELISERYGVTDYITFDPEMLLRTAEGEKLQKVKVAATWVGWLQIELIEPVSGFVDPFLPFLPADRSDAVPRLHHISLRRESLEDPRRKRAARTAFRLRGRHPRSRLPLSRRARHARPLSRICLGLAGGLGDGRLAGGPPRGLTDLVLRQGRVSRKCPLLCRYTWSGDGDNVRRESDDAGLGKRGKTDGSNRSR